MQQLKVETWSSGGWGGGRTYASYVLIGENLLIDIGIGTKGSQAIWKLFVEGKKVSGEPGSYTVALSEKEATVFRLLHKADIAHKRKRFEAFLAGEVTKEKFLEQLENELPLLILGNKLRGERR